MLLQLVLVAEILMLGNVVCARATQVALESTDKTLDGVDFGYLLALN